METLDFEKYRQDVINTTSIEDCPVYKTLELFRGKWTVRVLFELSKSDSIRFGELKKLISEITNTMLASTLKELENANLVVRVQFNEIPPHVEYSLTESGKALFPLFTEMAVWGKKYL